MELTILPKSIKTGNLRLHLHQSQSRDFRNLTSKVEGEQLQSALSSNLLWNLRQPAWCLFASLRSSWPVSSLPRGLLLLTRVPMVSQRPPWARTLGRQAVQPLELTDRQALPLVTSRSSSRATMEPRSSMTATPRPASRAASPKASWAAPASTANASASTPHALRARGLGAAARARFTLPTAMMRLATRRATRKAASLADLATRTALASARRRSRLHSAVWVPFHLVQSIIYTTDDLASQMGRTFQCFC